MTSVYVYAVYAKTNYAKFHHLQMNLAPNLASKSSQKLLVKGY